MPVGYWDLRHGRLEYENVYSVTEDAKLRMRLVNLLRTVIQSDRPSKVLIPGCGSRACLERELVESFSTLSVLATDYLGVVEAAAARLCHPRVDSRPKTRATWAWMQLSTPRLS
jgi:hypothetical protein